MSYCCLVREDKASLEIEKEIKTRIKLSYNDVDPEIVVAIGGDGTIIKASHLYPNAIIFGIHTGHLGFYANYSVDELDLLIDDINNKNYCIEKLKLLSCEIEDSLGNVIKENALNEITVVTPPRTLTLDVKIDGEFLERFRGTGLCISTPSGSTAYNKSLGGSVIDPSLKAFQLTEIASINNRVYKTIASPIILSQKNKVVLVPKNNSNIYISVDGESLNIKDVKEIKCSLSDKKIIILSHYSDDFWQRLKRSFIWKYKTKNASTHIYLRF